MSNAIKISEECLNQANAFYNTANSIDYKKDMKMLYPYVVNITFACELYIKYIIKKEKGFYKKEHCIYELFLQLDTFTQSLIENNYKKKCAINLLTTLKEEGENFINWRYAFEKSSLSIKFSFWKAFSETLKEYAEGLK